MKPSPVNLTANEQVIFKLSAAFMLEYKPRQEVRASSQSWHS